MFNHIKRNIGIKLFLIFTANLCVCIFFVVVLSSRYSSHSENLVIAQNKQYVQTQALNFLAELTEQRAQKYEAVFQKLSAYSKSIARQAELRLQFSEPQPPGTRNISQPLTLHPQNGIFYTELSAPAMICYWGGTSIPGPVANEINHLAPIAPILADAKMSNPEVAASHLIMTSGVGHYYPNNKEVFLLPPVTELDLRDTNNYVLANPANNPERKTVWVPVYFDDVGNGLITTASSPIYSKDGNFLGVAGLDVPLSRINQTMLDRESKTGSQSVVSFLLDNHGKIISFPMDQLSTFGIETSMKSFKNSLDLLNKGLTDSSLKEVRDLAEKIFSVPMQTSLFSLRGESFIVSSKLLPTIGWRLVNVISEETFLAPINAIAETLPSKIEALRKQFYLIATLFLIGSLVMALFFLERLFLQPLKQITDAAVLIKSGNLDARLDIHRSDEIGSLAKAFNVMAESLRQNKKIEQDYSQELENQVAAQTVELRHQKQVLEKTLLELEEDITRRKQVESELIQARESAESANRAKSNFLANVTHELRTPLIGVLGMNELLLQTSLNEWQKDLAIKVQGSGETLLSLISDILDFSKIESDQFSLECVAVDLPALVENTTQMFAEKAAEKGLSLACRISPEARWKVSADPLRLRQILLNLISNAVKFTLQGEIVVRLDMSPQEGYSGRFTLEVQDTGIGIKLDEDQDTIFSPFTQIETPKTRAFDGTGLGLSIVRQLAAAMNGEVGVESSLNEGSLFRVQLTLPLLTYLQLNGGNSEENSGCHRENPDRASIITRESVPKRKTEDPRARILIADDYALTRELVNCFLEDDNLIIDEATSGIEVLELVEMINYDLILMDCNMPDMDGIEATRLLRKRGDATPIVAMSAHVDSRIYEECKIVGMNDHLSKPFRREQLKSIINRWLPVGQEAAFDV